MPKSHIGEKQHGDQGDPELCHDCVAAGAKKSFDFQVLLYVLEKQLDLPASLVNIGDGLGGQMEIVGQKEILLAGIWISVAYSA